MAIAVGRFYLHREKGDTQQPGFYHEDIPFEPASCVQKPGFSQLETQHHDRCWASYLQDN
jgi:hypothetical protein